MKKKSLLLIIPFIGLIVSCGSTNTPVPTKEAVFRVNYDYGLCCKKVDSETGEETGVITTLFNLSLLNFDIPEPKEMLIPGDILTLKYTGELMVQETYPGRAFISNGKVISASYSYVDVIDISSSMVKVDGKLSEINDYSYRDNYVIIDEDLNYMPLEDFEGDELFASYQTASKNEGKYLGALFAFNPRP